MVFIVSAGLYYPIASKLELSGDLGYFHIENFENEDAETPERMYSLQARINLEYKFKSRISFFASGGYGMTRYYDKNKFYDHCFRFPTHSSLQYWVAVRLPCR